MAPAIFPPRLPRTLVKAAWFDRDQTSQVCTQMVCAIPRHYRLYSYKFAVTSDQEIPDGLSRRLS